MEKSPDAFRTISEVADWLGVQAHVLRFWESKFTQVKPIKRAGGRRYYRPADMRLLGGIKKLLHDDGLTIKGVQKILREQGVAHVSELSQPLEVSAADLEMEPAEPPAQDPLPKVVPFQSKPRSPEPDPPQSTQIRLDLGADPEPETKPETPAPAAEATGLPSFLKRPLQEADSTPETADNPPPETAADTPEPATDTPAHPRPRVIEAPDPPEDESALPYSPGVLGRLARIDALTPAQAAEIAPLVRALREWTERVAQTGVR